MKRQLIVFGEDWGGLPSSTQHIIKQLRRDYEITWVNSLGLRTPRANWRDVKRIFVKALRMLGQLLPVKGRSSQSSAATSANDETEFRVMEPQYIPLLSVNLVRKINRLLLLRLMKRWTASFTEYRGAVIWVSLPNAVDALHYIEKTGLIDPVVVYYCCDDFSALHGVDHLAVTAYERELMVQADLIIATSDELVRKFPKDKTHMIPHGVDTSLFNKPAPRAIDLPTGKPIAGFYGSIAEWVDVDLMAQVAAAMPNWHFVFIGTIKVDVSTLERLSNVIFLGAKAHQDLPRYSQHWDVSLLPFQLNEQIIASNPLKLREYMAAGRAIVSIDFPQVHQYKEFIELANGAQQFVAAINRALQQPESQRQLRKQRVASESWSSVAKQINGLIQAVS